MPDASPLNIRPKTPADDSRLIALWSDHFGAAFVVARGRRIEPAALDGFIAEERDKLLGAVTFERVGNEIEIVTLDSVVENRGAGTALLEAVVARARAVGARRVFLVTTNDNIRALRFYQKRGFDMVAVHRGAVDAARKLKPEIPLAGNDGIPIRHEVEYELRLA